MIDTIGEALPMREMDIPFAFTIGNHDGSVQTFRGNFDHERGLAKSYWSTRMPDLNYISNEHFPARILLQFFTDDIFVISRKDASGH